MFFSRSQTKAKAAERAVASERVRGLVRAVFGLDPDDAVSVTEIACPDPGCPDVETAILLMRTGRATVAVKVGKPLAAVEGPDLEAARAAMTDAPG